ncbi:MAG: hypothetical protein BRC33_13290 [Cyanobacteria bacterium SW_9_44_58]|nr:MAG: hypothetical protein BRC33_13290 [Cyanobacteria bacterium SW_9_44_58]
MSLVLDRVVSFYVTNARLSPAASKLGVDLGEPTTLPNGKEIGTTVDCGSIDTNTTKGYTCTNSEVPNQVAFMKGNMIVKLLATFQLNE